MDFLWERAKELKLTWAELARRLGVDESEIHYLREGRHLPSRRVISSIFYTFPELTDALNAWLVLLEHQKRRNKVKEGK